VIGIQRLDRCPSLFGLRNIRVLRGDSYTYAYCSLLLRVGSVEQRDPLGPNSLWIGRYLHNHLRLVLIALVAIHLAMQMQWISRIYFKLMALMQSLKVYGEDSGEVSRRCMSRRSLGFSIIRSAGLCIIMPDSSLMCQRKPVLLEPASNKNPIS
jgi:hypothetical protein